MRRMLKRTAATLLSLALLGSGLTAMPEGTLRLNAPLTASAADDTVVKTGNILYLRGNPTRKSILNYVYDKDITEIFAMEGASLPTDCSYLFKGTDNYWPKLKTVDLSHANTSSVTDMEGMFNSHSGLTTVNLSGIDTSKVEDMSSMFASTSLSHIDLSSFNTSNVEDMRWMFYNCENLTYLDLTGFSSESLDYAQSMFKDCINLKRIFTTDRFRYYVQSNTQGMFGNCYSLVGGNGTTYDKSKDAESYNGLYARLSDQAGETSFFTRRCAKLDYWQENGTEWATLTLTGNVDGDIMRSLYRDTDSLRSVIRIVKTDGTAVLPEDCTGLFEGYENLVNVEFYDIDSSNVTTTEAMFRNCPELWQVDISGMDTSNVIYMYQMFCNCCELVTITVGDGWTIENCSTLSCKEMFLDCVKIRGEKGTTYDSTDSWASYGVFAHVDEAPSNPGYLWFHYLDMDFDTCTLTLHGNITKQRLEYTLSDITVKHIIAAPGTVFPADSSQFFTSCKDVVSMDLSAADTSNVTDMSEMFSGLTGLETLDITGWDTSNVTDMQQMFYQDSRLKTVYVGSGWTTEAVQAEGGRDYSYQMLGGCTSLVGTLGNMLGTHPTNKAYANLDSLDDEGVFSTKSFTYNFSNENLYLNGEIDRSLLIRYWGSPYGRPFINGIVANEGTVLPESCRYLFSGFENAKYIDLSHADASHVTDMTGMFCDNETGLTNLQRISFGAAFDISNVTTMEMMFYNCSALTSLDLSFFRTDQLQIVRGMFANCSSLKTVYINPETWKLLYGAAVYHNGMFAGCTSIVGANGTVYDSTHTNKLYARLDKDGEPGYFSARCYTFSNGKLTIFGQVNLYEVYSFPNKDLVTEIYAKEGTVLPEDCEGLFSDYSNVTKIDLSNADFSNVTTMKCMFRWCESLDTLNLGNADTSNVTDMAEMFRGCKALKSLAIKNLNTSNVTDISEMFDGCESLTTVNLSGFNTAKVTTMYSMFDGCKALTGVDLSSFDTSKVTNMHSMFRGCEALTKLDLTNFNTGSLQVIEEMFKDCTKLKAIYVSVSLWSTASVCAGWDHNVFKGCTALVGLNGTKYNAENVSVEYARPDYPEQPGYLSYYCFDLDQETGVLTLHDMLYQPQLSTLQLNYGSKITSVTALPGTVFPPNSSKMFEDYVKVVSFDLSNADTSNVKNMSYMFRNCASLQTLDLGSFDTRKVTNMAGMFYDCKNLTELNISSFDTSHVTDMSYMFDSCKKMTSLDLSFFDTHSVTNMACMFAYDSLMTDLNLSSFDTGKVTNMRHMFNGCAMTTLDLSAFSNSSLTNVSYMFYECKNLTTIYASDRWLPDQKFSTDYMFYNCKALVGGNGTQCSGEYSLHDSRARIDEPGKPGYFTRNLLFNLSFRYNCEFNNNISLYYAVPQEALVGYSNIRLVVNKEEYAKNAAVSTVSKRVITDYTEKNIQGTPYYMFVFSGITSTDMSNNLSASIYADKDGNTYQSQCSDYSIKEYAHNRLDNSNSSTYKRMLVDMLNYGAAAQIHFGKNTAHLANADLTAEQRALGSQSVPTLKNCEKTIPLQSGTATVTFGGNNLTFDNNIILMYRLSVAKGQSMNNVKMVLTYKTSKGVNKEVTIPASAFTKKNGYYIVNFDSLAITDVRSVITATVYDGNKAISDSFQYSIEAYAYNRMENSNSETFKALVRETMKYGVSAETHFS